MSCLICGSLAYDTIMDFGGRFADQILPDKIHMLNVAFLVPTLRREFGGCAGNIAYSLHLLGGEPVVLATVGTDGVDYEARLDRLGIARNHVRMVPNMHTAQAHIMTDRDNNQITAFHPGAMNEAHTIPVPPLPSLRLGIIAPDGRDAMLTHAAQLVDADIPFIFDPGQALPMFDGPELEAFIEKADWVVVNDYEAAMLCERTGRTPQAIAAGLRGMVVTRGAHGCVVYEDGALTEIAALPPAATVDPTGCGDAFRGGLLWALEQGWTLSDAARMGNVIGARKIACAGPQNYHLTRAEALETLRAAYGRDVAPA